MPFGFSRKKKHKEQDQMKLRCKVCDGPVTPVKT